MAPEALDPNEVGRLFPSFSIGNETTEERLNLRWPASVKFQPSPTDAATGQDANGDGSRTRGLGKNSESQLQTPNSKALQIYQPMVGRQLRLLRLSRASSPSDPLHGQLETADLGEQPQYEALSYTWADANGDASKCKVIYLGRSWAVLPITANCEAALRRLRQPAWDRLLWVDAICIDQSDTGERTHQVGIMQYIYATAQSVTIYLGETLVDRDDLATLVRMPYFSRIWIIQEVAAARRATVIYGPHKMDWAEFRDEWLRRITTGIEPRSQNASFQWFKYAKRLELLRLETGLYYILRDTSHFEASDARDKVFAILGLFMDAAFEGFSADYSLSVCEVFAGLSAHLLMGSPFQFEFLLSLAMKQQTLPGLPSWALDWSSLQAPPWMDLPNTYLLDPSTSRYSLGGSLFSTLSWALLPTSATLGLLTSQCSPGGSFMPRLSWPRQLTRDSTLTSRQMPHFERTGVMSITGIPYLRLRGRGAESGRLLTAQYSHHVMIRDSNLFSSNKPFMDGDEIWLLKDISFFVHLRKQPNTEQYNILSHCSVDYPKEWLKEFGLVWQLRAWEWLLWPPRVRSEADPWLLCRVPRWLSRDSWTAVKRVCAAVRRLRGTELRCWMRRLIWRAVYTLGVRRNDGPATAGPATSVAAQRLMRAEAQIVECGRAQRTEVDKMLAVALSELDSKDDPKQLLARYREALLPLDGLLAGEPIAVRQMISLWVAATSDDPFDDARALFTANLQASMKAKYADENPYSVRFNILMRLDLKTHVELALASFEGGSKYPGPDLLESGVRRTILTSSGPWHMNDLVRAFEAVCRRPYDADFVGKADAGEDSARQMLDEVFAQETDGVLVTKMRADAKHWDHILRFVKRTEEHVLPYADVFVDQPPSFRAWLSAEGMERDLSSYEVPISIV